MILDLKSNCSVEGYSGSLYRAHDVLTDICDDHVIWWPRREWTEWIPKFVYGSYDSQRSVQLHRVDKVRWSRRVCKRHRKCWKFSKYMLSFYRNQNLWDSISEAIWTWQSYPLYVFCWFQINKDDITIVAQHVRDLFTTAAERPSQRRDWNASAFWNHEFSNTNLETFFPKTYGISDRHLRNDS